MGAVLLQRNCFNFMGEVMDMRTQRDSTQLFDELEHIIAEQDEQITSLQKQIHKLATQVVATNRSIGAALVALQLGTSLDVRAAIEILRKG